VLKNYGFIDALGRSNFAMSIKTAFKKAGEYITYLEEYNKLFGISLNIEKGIDKRIRK
jgi:hypothetical protein